ncbi:hypothetical protein [Chitinimonas lacunae]|uniref:HNH endonuclease n=1 Tax=Chitinimonas lacunae TaxID=1963018 RepID=A0ABV8MJH8_9NEIS
MKNQNTNPILGICQLCLKVGELCNSHIIPEFLYKKLYNKNHQMMGINGRFRKGWKPVQIGEREHLLCESCEQHLANKIESAFKAMWVEANPLPDPWPSTEHIAQIKVDYPLFKLFHLSVLFRAGVSTRPQFNCVRLGSHEEKLREMLLELNPGKQNDYQIFGYAVIDPKTNRIRKLIAGADQKKFDGLRWYRFIYGGVWWWISASSHANLNMAPITLRENGTMVIRWFDWSNIPIIQKASALLRNSKV